MDWNDHLNLEQCAPLLTYIANMNYLLNISVPRFVVSINYQIWIFSDDSQWVYNVCDCVVDIPSQSMKLFLSRGNLFSRKDQTIPELDSDAETNSFVVSSFHCCPDYFLILR